MGLLITAFAVLGLVGELKANLTVLRVYGGITLGLLAVCIAGLIRGLDLAGKAPAVGMGRRSIR